jgi:hypothetical protein
VFNNDRPVLGVEISVRVIHAGDHTELFRGTTDENGYYQVEWEIGPNSNPGVFRVNVIATFDGWRAEKLTTFEVKEA